MFSYRLGTALVLGSVFLASCSSTRIRTDYDPQAQFSDLATYSWIGGSNEDGDDSLALSPWLERHIRGVADRTLLNMGYHRLTAGEPDFRVDYHVTSNVETPVDPYYSNGRYFGYGSGYRGYGYGGYGYGGYGHRGFGHRGFGYRGFGHSRFGYYGSYRPYNARLRATLVLEIFDARTDELIWRGTTSTWLNVDPEPEKLREFLGEATEDILKEFPSRRGAENAPPLVTP